MSRRKNRVSLFSLLLGAGAGFIIYRHVRRQTEIEENPDFFANKVVLITGASRGIGRTFALALARRGAHLVIASRNISQLKAVKKECQKLNPDIIVYYEQTDVSDEEDLQNLVNTSLKQFGQINILINNAGVVEGGAFADKGPQAAERVINVNLMAAMRLTYLVLPNMIERQSGVVVNIASVAGGIGIPYFSSYSISKFGLIGFSESLRREVAYQGIQVLTVKPGFADTDLVDPNLLDRLKFARIGDLTPEEIVDKTLDAIVLGDKEVNIGLIETVASWLNNIAPRLADMISAWIVDEEFRQIASKHHTD